MCFRLGHSSKMRKTANFLEIKKTEIASADIPAGYTCPAANICKAFAHPVRRKVIDGRHAEFRCYAASIEAVFPNTMKLHWDNYTALLNTDDDVSKMTDILSASIPDKLKVLRIHSFGDFFSANYFEAWTNTARNFPNVTFFNYTKLLPYIVERDKLPMNFFSTYSVGGVFDHLLPANPQVPYSMVVRTPEEAEEKGLPLACSEHPADDIKFVMEGTSFALLLHGTQPAKKK